MSSLENRLEAFRQLPLRAQLALIASTRANPVLAKNQEYLESLERIHAQCLQISTAQEKAVYDKAKENLTLEWKRLDRRVLLFIPDVFIFL